MATADESTATKSAAPHDHFPRFWLVLAGLVGAVALFWLAPAISSAVSAIDLSEVHHLYAIIGGFVVLDAVFPVFPSESLLTTGSNLAAQDGSNISLWGLIAAGTIGAVVGDSLLYWLSRGVLRRSMAAKVEQAEQNEKVARPLKVLNQTASLLIVFGRFVPGLRFLIGATMGLTRYPYPRFLFWDIIGSLLWASYTCVCSYLIATVIHDQPLISIVTSVIVTTGLLALLYRPLKRHWVDAGSAPPDTAQR